MQAGDCFGDMAFQENSVNTYAAIAVEHATLMGINHSMVDHLPDNVQLIIYTKLSLPYTFFLLNDDMELHRNR